MSTGEWKEWMSLKYVSVFIFHTMYWYKIQKVEKSIQWKESFLFSPGHQLPSQDTVSAPSFLCM